MRSGLADPEAALEQRELFATIAALPDDFRHALVAVDLVGLSYREAGRLLGVREATITTRVYRARQRVVRTLSTGASERPDHRDEPTATSPKSTRQRPSGQ
jgi:RNA polymerase sigma-70 factor (ECF subfamily)